MKTTYESKPVTATIDADASAVARYQIYHQTRSGVFTPGFKSDSATEVVEAFMKQAPDFEGGALRIWNHREQRVSASVEWRKEKTEFGFLVHHRTNLFHDRLLGLIARQVEERETMRTALRQEARLTLVV